MSVIEEKSYTFATNIVTLYQTLIKTYKAYPLFQQLLRSGTSIGANTAEAQGGVSKADFSLKISVAYKECLESKYWIKLLRDTGYIEPKQANRFIHDADELARIAFAILKNTRIKKKE